MTGDTAIEWTDKSWNPTKGCTQVSPGCAHCYAKTLTERFHGKGSFDTVVLHPERLDAPLHWRKPSRVFVNSMSDLFHEDIPDSFIGQVFEMMRQTPQHTYQVLTKRPERMQEFCRLLYAAPLPNVWLGVTVENQQFANERIPKLMLTPAVVHFVSAEPLLAPVDFTKINMGKREGQLGKFDQYLDALNGTHCDGMGFERKLKAHHRLDWIIVGGESGPKHRPFDPKWARSVVRQCRTTGVAVFVKQLGGARPGNKLEDLPEDLRVREYPV